MVLVHILTIMALCLGDGYREFRGVAARHYDTMKEYYQKAALAYSKGDKSYAAYLAE